jgi:hypothetical protein
MAKQNKGYIQYISKTMEINYKRQKKIPQPRDKSDNIGFPGKKNKSDIMIKGGTCL